MLKFYSFLHKFSHSYEQVFHRQKKLFADLFREQSTTITTTTSTKKLPMAARTSKSNMKMKFGTEMKGTDFIHFILKLISEPEVEFTNTDLIAQLIVQIFADSERFQYEQSTSVGDRISTTNNDNAITFSSLPSPTGKEFIIRSTGISRPAPYSRPSSHRMYCFLSKDFRIASAFTEDTAYF
ncbi:hypothetical protein BLA29_012069, partial [Euroglyphus maynei]